MPKRETAAAASKRSAGLTTEKAKAAGRANLAKGRAARQKKRDEANAESPRDSATVRWSKLLDGTLTVKDLDSEEIDRMQVKGKDGMFNGPRPKMPSHLTTAFRTERMRRGTAKYESILGKALDKLEDILDDPEASNADLLKAIGMVSDRVLGKAEQTVHVDGESPFERLTADAVGLDREMADLSDEHRGQDGS